MGNPVAVPALLAIWQDTLLRGAAELSLSLTDAQVSRLRAHLELVFAHNARSGLTSLTDPAELAVKHYVDSLTCLLVCDLHAGEQVADIGPGGGFPGLVLAIMRPETHFTLIESSAKRAEFLRLAARELDLPHVEVLPVRAEDAGRDSVHREQYDLAVGRAVAPLPVLVEYLLPLVRVGGQALAMKGPEVGEELAAAQHALTTLGAHVAELKELALPEGMGQRALVLLEKTDPTPARYPRRAGIPTKRPL